MSSTHATIHQTSARKLPSNLNKSPSADRFEVINEHEVICAPALVSKSFSRQESRGDYNTVQPSMACKTQDNDMWMQLERHQQTVKTLIIKNHDDLKEFLGSAQQQTCDHVAIRVQDQQADALQQVKEFMQRIELNLLQVCPKYKKNLHEISDLQNDLQSHCKHQAVTSQNTSVDTGQGWCDEMQPQQMQSILTGT